MKSHLSIEAQRLRSAVLEIKYLGQGFMCGCAPNDN
jgi:hypothetical protein